MVDALWPANIREWSAQLVVTPIELKLAVASVDTPSADVRTYFGLSEIDVWPPSDGEHR